MPEQKAAWMALQDLAIWLVSGKGNTPPNPLYLHGSPGTGKTHLLLTLVKEVTRSASGILVSHLAAEDLVADGLHPDMDTGSVIQNNDLVIVEDLQHLSTTGVAYLLSMLDFRLNRHLPLILTGNVGPRQLADIFPGRLTTRLAGGLVVALEPWSPGSRLTYLQELAQRRQLALPHELLAWLAQHLRGNGRVLEGALTKVQGLLRSQPRLDKAALAEHFREQLLAATATVEHIAQRVGDYFRVAPRYLQSRRRHRNVLWPRQVGMFLARQLTRLSLDQIGAYFGGRDHSTVLHACRKVAGVLHHDAALGGTIRQLQEDLRS